MKPVPVTEEKYEEIVDAWNTLACFLGEQLGLTNDEIDAKLDGIDSYFDLDNPDHWPEIINSILSLRDKPEST